MSTPSTTVAPRQPAQPDPDDALDERQAAPILGTTVSWLQRARWAGTGPPYRKIGRSVRYIRRELIAYRDARTHNATSEYAGAARDSQTTEGA